MKSWDDFYQEQVARGNRPPIAQSLRAYRGATQDFYKRWASAEREGRIQDPINWGNDPED